MNRYYKVLFTLTLLLISKWSIAQNDMEEEAKENVLQFIEWVKTNQIDSLKTRVAYPLHRYKPVPSIKNEQEFVERYHQVFDEALIKEISDSKIEDWSKVGWRGIMLNRGSLWMDEWAYAITGINHTSDFEKEWSKKLLEELKGKIHESLKDFKDPSKIIKTNKYLVRIDELENGKYRYACWSANAHMNEKPDLILTNGELRIEGTGGNHRYIFTSGPFKYEVPINVIGPDEIAPAYLRVYKNDDLIVDQEAEIVE